MCSIVRLVVQVKLLPTSEQAAALEATLHAANRAANLVAALAYRQRCFRNFDLRKHTYDRIKAEFALAAQAAQHVIKKVCDAYRTLHANLAAGSLGKPGSARRIKAESKPISFRPLAAQPYDDRCLSWQHTDQTVSIWTTAGRLKGVETPPQEARFAANTDHVIAKQIVTALGHRQVGSHGSGNAENAFGSAGGWT